MALLCDTSGIVAAIHADDRAHGAVREFLDHETGRLIVTDFVVAEVDYLLVTNAPAAAEEAFLDDVLRGAWSREPLLPVDLARGLEIVKRYREHHVGITDAVWVALAERLRITRMLTLDRRHFRMFRFADRKRFRIFPEDLNPT